MNHKQGGQLAVPRVGELTHPMSHNESIILWFHESFCTLEFLPEIGPNPLEGKLFLPLVGLRDQRRTRAFVRHERTSVKNRYPP